MKIAAGLSYFGLFIGICYVLAGGETDGAAIIGFSFGILVSLFIRTAIGIYIISSGRKIDPMRVLLLVGTLSLIVVVLLFNTFQVSNIFQVFGMAMFFGCGISCLVIVGSTDLHLI